MSSRYKYELYLLQSDHAEKLYGTFDHLKQAQKKYGFKWREKTMLWGGTFWESKLQENGRRFRIYRVRV